MSDKSHKGSTLAALALAGIVALHPGAATSQENVTTPGANTTVAEQQQQRTIRYLDFTQRNDGWALSQNAAIVGSRDNRIVIVSYSDPQTTRAFYDLATSYARAPHNLPIFGVVRAQDHPTEKSRNGFDVFFNGVPLGEMENPDNAFARTDLMRGLFDSIREHYFASNVTAGVKQGEASPIQLARNTTGKTGESGGRGGDDSSGRGGGGGGADSTEIAAVAFNPDF